jgi:diacylglycerol kinase (ATP)
MTDMSLRARLRSFAHASAGLARLLREEPNARIHLAVSLVVVSMGLFFSLAGWEWVALILAIAIVWIAEALNTALERLCDAVTREHDARIGAAKDLAAGAVLLASAAAALVGGLVLGPHLWRLFVA